MTVEQFLQSLSYLMWASYWSVIFYKFFKNNKNNKDCGGDRMKRFIAIWIVLSATLNIWQCVHIKNLEKKRPILIYKADNQGSEIKGKVVHKEKIGDMYTVTVQNYGIFVVTQTNYESLKIGDEVRL